MWLREIVNVLLLAIFFWEIDASVYLLICPTVRDHRIGLILTIPQSNSCGGKRRDFILEEICINKTLPPKELNVPRKEPSEALLISVMKKKIPDMMRVFRR